MSIEDELRRISGSDQVEAATASLANIASGLWLGITARGVPAMAATAIVAQFMHGTAMGAAQHHRPEQR